ncbi:hypothetical protein D7M11_31960 [Paenibacillus ginsengarvi]|uniref:Uncharacterized protein n=1 Tax=Paenibacillus ginsengarvi TaxID=400777 RepID=A0A3B0AZN1_9BACL|nr:hypothetical protein D7M11_31960 [Paenibacillus ginsengarvi]
MAVFTFRIIMIVILKPYEKPVKRMKSRFFSKKAKNLRFFSFFMKQIAVFLRLKLLRLLFGPSFRIRIIPKMKFFTQKWYDDGNWRIQKGRK